MPTWSLFGKYMQGRSIEEAADLCASLGFDRLALPAREGYPTGGEGWHRRLTHVVHACARRGLGFDLVLDEPPGELASRPDLLNAIAEAGLCEFRCGWIRRAEGPVRRQVEQAGGELAVLAEASADCGVRAVYQLHHGTLISAGSLLWTLVRDIDPAGLGIMLDPGNQMFEGWEPFEMQLDLLMPWFTWVGVKDVLPVEREGRWDQLFCPAPTGRVPWQDLFRQLRRTRFDRTLMLMPFYEMGDPNALAIKLAQEFEWAKQAWGKSALKLPVTD